MDETTTHGLSRDLIVPYLKPLSPVETGLQFKGELKPPIRCLLCDIYGTLLISASGDVGRDQTNPSRNKHLAQLLSRHGITRSVDEMIAALHDAVKRDHAEAKERGVDYPEVRIDAIWQQLLPDKNRQQVLEFAIEYEMVSNPVWPMPHFLELLSTCRKRRILLGIISNAQFFTPNIMAWLTETSLEKLGFRSDLTFYSYRYGVAKPSGRLFQMAAEQLKKEGIEPHQTAYMGNDMRKDILPAKQQAFQTILFAGDARSLRMDGESDEIEISEPDLIVTQLNQVISSLQPDE